MVTGLTRSFTTCFDEVTRVLDPKPGEHLFGMSIFLSRNRTVFIADTSVNELPTSEELADIAVATAAKAREFGHEPRVALLSFSNFGNPPRRGRNAFVRPWPSSTAAGSNSSMTGRCMQTLHSTFT